MFKVQRAWYSPSGTHLYDPIIRLGELGVMIKFVSS
jgi:hypothetical protein